MLNHAREQSLREDGTLKSGPYLEVGSGKNMAAHTPKDFCGDTVHQTVNLIGGKWTMLILWRLLEREHRYADLHRQVGDVSQKVLSSELKTLVQAGLVEREVNPTTPPRRSPTGSPPKDSLLISFSQVSGTGAKPTYKPTGWTQAKKFPSRTRYLRSALRRRGDQFQKTSIWTLEVDDACSCPRAFAHQIR